MTSRELWSFFIVQAIADLVFAVKLIILDGRTGRGD